ncbi:UvrD-helicase domain-containing protein [Rhizobium laguerreae]|uniref:UvrD-helicase domain-containing protein n=1 Tax=Rhizobium laguerreae TaxID=1076926 RepID=UPI00144184B2|nr:UvrD-helicase domain-containing protein [Rhizobium laguerreae]NKM25898.1 AAA family ATPase [Rhizobium laguerreae]
MDYKPQKLVATATQAISYYTTKTFDRSLSKAIRDGGQNRKKADKVRIVLGSLRDLDPFASISPTNHGETRISNAVKYDLGDGWRLVTQQHEKACVFLFVGDHEDVDKWLDGQKGLQFAVRDARAVVVPGAGEEISHRGWHRADHHDKPLADRLDQEAMDHALRDVTRSVARRLEALDARSSTKELEAILSDVPEPTRQFVYSVFNLLLAGNYDGAQDQVDLSLGRISSLEKVDESELLEIKDGEDIRRLRLGSKEYEDWLTSFEKRSSWQEWFLYLHPEQEKVVQANYPGVSQLSGVSGAGKTCVAVRRALRLAEGEGSRVLLLTLNRSLAGLLTQLVESSCINEDVRGRIEVTSFFELAQRLLHEFEPSNDLLYSDVTWKHDEHVDLIFREYYRQWLNNSTAKVLLPLHKSLTARGVNSETYVREEFDWIRSAVALDARKTYLDMERKGRKFGILSERRADILQGLAGWERKMRDIGVVDYLGLTAALSKHLPSIKARYTHILVDEAQDFGTTELSVVRQLVPVAPNDIFLCGDIAQTILPKHRNLVEAGITAVSRERIQKNYRNSREILKAAYEVLSKNLSEDMLDSEDLEILDPKFANFSGHVPMALAAETLEEEIAYARAYAQTSLLGGARTVCIAFAGFSARDVKAFAARCGATALDGAYDPSSDPLVFCDLEQTKGYEFDVLIILNCRDGVLPPHDAPEEEAYRASCKLYVAMTRAKRELVLSFHDKASPWIEEVSETIGADFWKEVEVLPEGIDQLVPECLPEIEPDKEYDDLGKSTGLQFVYSNAALKLSLEAQDKLIELVDGKGLRSAGIGMGGRRLRWQNMQTALADLRESRRSDNQFGPVVATEIRALAARLVISNEADRPILSLPS